MLSYELRALQGKILFSTNKDVNLAAKPILLFSFACIQAYKLIKAAVAFSVPRYIFVWYLFLSGLCQALFLLQSVVPNEMVLVY